MPAHKGPHNQLSDMNLGMPVSFLVLRPFAKAIWFLAHGKPEQKPAHVGRRPLNITNEEDLRPIVSGTKDKKSYNP
jgi:hypothetical protein